MWPSRILRNRCFRPSGEFRMTHVLRCARISLLRVIQSWCSLALCFLGCRTFDEDKCNKAMSVVWPPSAGFLLALISGVGGVKILVETVGYNEKESSRHLCTSTQREDMCLSIWRCCDNSTTRKKCEMEKDAEYIWWGCVWLVRLRKKKNGMPPITILHILNKDIIFF